MSIADFLSRNREPLRHAWVKHVDDMRPAAAPAAGARAEQIEALLSSMADGLNATNGAPETAESVLEAARTYAAARLAEGATLNEVVADYHSLRSIVTNGWRSDPTARHGGDAIDELAAFDRALDASLAEACRWYLARVEDARELLNGILAHDLRTPLSAILNSAESIIVDASLTEAQKAPAARIRLSGLRMKRIIEDVLDFTRTRLRNTLPVTLAQADVGEIVEGVAAELGSFNPRVPICCTTGGELSLQCDGSRIEQLASNLLSNAIEHAGAGTPVTIDAEGFRGEVQIRVHNFGHAIPPSEQSLIFYPLMRAMRRQSRGAGRKGLGLGLYIARQIAQAHGGNVEVSSSERDGTTFLVRLPRDLRRQRQSG